MYSQDGLGFRLNPLNKISKLESNLRPFSPVYYVNKGMQLFRSWRRNTVMKFETEETGVPSDNLQQILRLSLIYLRSLKMRTLILCAELIPAWSFDTRDL